MSIIEEDELLPAHDQFKQCKICLDNDNLDDLISPCLCSGGSAYVHRKCLNNWRAENARGRAFKFCDICQFEYINETVLNDPKADRERLLKYHLFVIRDLTAIMLLVQSVIIGLALLLKTVDRNGNNIKRLFPASINGFAIYYLSASVLLLAILGLFVLIIFFFYAGTGTNNRGSTSRNYFTNSKGNANGLFATAVIMVLVCAFIGIFVGIILSIVILRKIMKHHTSKLWLRQEAEKYIVKDFQGRRQELEKYKKSS